MEKNFLTIDWDYFIDVHNAKSNSYRETQEDILSKWYREYLVALEEDQHLETGYTLGAIYDEFLEEVLPNLRFDTEEELILSESHAAAYQEAINSHADYVYLWDAHSDLGYGGLEALNYEVNCANWLGKLLKERQIKKAYIIYSPYTKEETWEFDEMIKAYPICFMSLKEFLLKNPYFNKIHICRSGPWTPPWYDHTFYELAKSFHLKVKDYVGGERDWHPKNLNLSEIINYKLGVI